MFAMAAVVATRPWALWPKVVIDLLSLLRTAKLPKGRYSMAIPTLVNLSVFCFLLSHHALIITLGLMVVAGTLMMLFCPEAACGLVLLLSLSGALLYGLLPRPPIGHLWLFVAVHASVLLLWAVIRHGMPVWRRLRAAARKAVTDELSYHEMIRGK